MNLHIYLDTSVFSAYYDERAVERQQQTEEFRARRNEFEVIASELAREELAQTLDPTRPNFSKGSTYAVLRLRKNCP
jgi:hypothetical protein